MGLPYNTVLSFITHELFAIFLSLNEILLCVMYLSVTWYHNHGRIVLVMKGHHICTNVQSCGPFFLRVT